jgi:uncharacterized protein (DUF2267 family)
MTSATGLDTFDTTVQATNVWLHDVMIRMGWIDREKAWRALRAVMHALRDRLAVNDAAHLAAQLPMLVRGMYYEGWHPADKPLKEHRADFLRRVREVFTFDLSADPERVIRAVFGTLEKHITPGEAEKVKAALPGDLRAFWP